MIDVFKKIITAIKGMGKSKSKDKDKKLVPEQLCKDVEDVASSNGYFFLTHEGVVYIFIRDHWQKIPKQNLLVFMKEAACSYLDDEVKGSRRKDIEELIKQFPYTTMHLGLKPAENKVNFLNCTLDLPTMTLTPHNAADFLCYVLPYNYDPSADCPIFKKYLNRVVPDTDAQNVLAEYVAWIFTDLKLEKVLFLYGSGRNGKSVFIDIVEALVGYDNVCHESISDMCGENGENHRSNIIGKLLNTCSDVSSNAFQGDVFKRLASGEPISAKILYQDVISSSNYAKMMFCLNELPKTNDHSSGYYRRMLIVPFNVQIPKSEIDPYLAKKIIKNELPGVMNWVLQGYSRLIKNQKFSDSKLIDSALEEYRNNDKKKKKSLIILPPY